VGAALSAREVLAAIAALASRSARAGLTAGIPLVLAGLLALTVATRGRRILALVGVAGLGAAAAALLRGQISVHLGLSFGPAAALLAGVGAAVGALFPAAFSFGAAALLGALLGPLIPLGGRPALGAAAAGLAAGLIGLALARAVAATVASLAGGLLLALGLVASFAARPIARELAGRPAVLLGFALVAGIAGAAFQISSPRAGPGARSRGSPSGATPEAGR
jgi:hypothetical protein